MNKRKIFIVAGAIFIVLLIATIITVLLVKQPKNENENKNNDEYNNAIVQNIKVTGKLKQYIEGLTNNYYIKYSGKFKDSSDELVDAIVEYTKQGENYGLRSNELNMQMICQGEKLYSVSKEYKIIIEMGRKSFNISEYNLASDIGQVFVKEYKEKVGSLEYEVEEYLYNGKLLKYYFLGKDLKLIKYDEREIKVIRLETKTNTELLEKPEGYTYAIS